jgi:hypothetical protein
MPRNWAAEGRVNAKAFSLLILREKCAKGIANGAFWAPCAIVLLLGVVRSRVNCVNNWTADTRVTDLGGKVVLCLESFGHGRAEEGEQEIVQDRFKENQGVRAIDRAPQAQGRRCRRSATIPVRGQEQGGAIRKGEVDRKRPARERAD